MKQNLREVPGGSAAVVVHTALCYPVLAVLSIEGGGLARLWCAGAHMVPVQGDPALAPKNPTLARRDPTLALPMNGEGINASYFHALSFPYSWENQREVGPESARAATEGILPSSFLRKLTSIAISFDYANSGPLLSQG